MLLSRISVTTRSHALVILSPFVTGAKGRSMCISNSIRQRDRLVRIHIKMAELIPGVCCGFCCGLLCGLAHGDEDSSYSQSRATTNVNQYVLPVQQQPAVKSHKTADLLKAKASRSPSEILRKSTTIKRENGKLDVKETTAPPNEMAKNPDATKLFTPNEVKSPSPKADDDKEKNTASPLEPDYEKKETKPEENKLENKVEEKKPENVTKGFIKEDIQPAVASGVIKNPNQQPNVNPPEPKEETKDDSPAKATGAEEKKKAEEGKGRSENVKIM